MSRSISNRREFLRSTAALAAGGAVVPYWLTGENARADETTSPNDRPNVALIGCGGRGTYDAKWAANFGQIVALCDVDRRLAEKAQEALGVKADIFGDYRKLLDRKDIELVINGTPDHWHTAINIAACKAGKDIYAEKPLSLTIDEGKIFCKVVEQTGRIVQVGTMQRSDKWFQKVVSLVRNGRIGKLKQVWISIPHYSTKGGPFAKQPVPPEMNWEMYQGQAPLHDYCRQRTLGTYRNWWEYSGGLATDWGNHHVDIAHWGMDCELSGPVSIDARGQFPNPEGPEYYNTPSQFFCRMFYPSGLEVLFFIAPREPEKPGMPLDTTPEETERLFGADAPEETKRLNRNGIMFIGEKGRVLCNRSGAYGKAVEELADNPLPDNAWKVYPSSEHMLNFFECAKSRKQPCTSVEIEHRAVTVCHLTNISIRLKRKIAWDPVKEQITGDDEANAMLRREQRAPYGISE
jgi:predicted dehydrogenase